MILTGTDNFESLFTLNAHNSAIIDAKFSSDGKSFVTCGKDQKVIYWSAPDLTLVPEEEEFSICENQFSDVEQKADESIRESSLSQDKSQIRTKKTKNKNRNCTVHVVKSNPLEEDAFHQFLADATSSLDKLMVRLGKIAKRAKQADERISTIESKSK